MYYVYALQSLIDFNWLYIGYSTDLKERISRHQNRKVKSTKNYLPVRLVYFEAYLHKSDAAKREYELKHSHQQKAVLKERIKNCLLG